MIDGAEFCTAEGQTFLNLNTLEFPVEMELVVAEPALSGKAANFTIAFQTTAGKPILPHDLAITHTERLHLLIVDTSLEDYHHVHPEPVGLTGEWSFSITPQKTGTYRVFAEMAPIRTRKKVIAQTEFRVSDAPDAVMPLKSGKVDGLGEYQFELNAVPAQLLTGQDNILTLSIRRVDAEPIELQLVMGAYAHLVAFDESLSGYAHLHPKYTGREKDPEPQLTFVFNTDQPGHYKIWAQFKIQGKEIFVPFEGFVGEAARG